MTTNKRAARPAANGDHRSEGERIAATSSGIRKVRSGASDDRNTEHTGKPVCYEVRAYNPQSERMECVGRYPTLDQARDATQAQMIRGAEVATNAARASRGRLIWPHCGRLIWPHLRPTARRPSEPSSAVREVCGKDAIDGGAVLADS